MRAIRFIGIRFGTERPQYYVVLVRYALWLIAQDMRHTRASLRTDFESNIPEMDKRKEVQALWAWKSAMQAQLGIAMTSCRLGSMQDSLLLFGD